MFIKNKFYNEYYNIINSKKKLNRVKSKDNYYEKHHIIPRSFGGSDDPDNLVLLTAQEHYRVHELLPHFTEGKYKRKMLPLDTFRTTYLSRFPKDIAKWFISETDCIYDVVIDTKQEFIKDDELNIFKGFKYNYDKASKIREMFRRCKGRCGDDVTVH